MTQRDFYQKKPEIPLCKAHPVRCHISKHEFKNAETDPYLFKISQRSQILLDEGFKANNIICCLCFTLKKGSPALIEAFKLQFIFL